MNCKSERCRSPVACGGFGYCREYNWPRASENTRTGLFQYVRHADVPAYHARGWMVVGDLGARHGAWACLMWRCDCGEGQ